MARRKPKLIDNGIHIGSIVIYNDNKHKVAYYNRFISPNEVYIFMHHKRGCVKWTTIEKVKLSEVTLFAPIVRDEN